MSLWILGVSPLGTSGDDGAVAPPRRAEGEITATGQGSSSVTVTANAGTPQSPSTVPMQRPGGGAPLRLVEAPVGGTSFTTLATTSGISDYAYDIFPGHQGSCRMPEEDAVIFWGHETHSSAAAYANALYRYDIPSGTLLLEYTPDPFVIVANGTPAPPEQPEGYCWSKAGIPFANKAHSRPWGQHGFRQFVRTGPHELTVFYKATEHCWFDGSIYNEVNGTYTTLAQAQLLAPETNPAWRYDTKVKKWTATTGTGLAKFVRGASLGPGNAVVFRPQDGCYYTSNDGSGGLQKYNPATGVAQELPNSTDGGTFGSYPYQGYSFILPDGKLVTASGSTPAGSSDFLFQICDPGNFVYGNTVLKRLSHYPELAGWRFVNVGCFLRGWTLYLLAYGATDGTQNRLFAFDLSNALNGGTYPVTDTGITATALGGGTGTYQLRTEYLPEYDAVLIANAINGSYRQGKIDVYRFSNKAPISITATGQGVSSAAATRRIPLVSVSNDGAADWAVCAAASADGVAGYAIRAAVQADRAAAWSVRAAVVADAPTAYAILSVAAADAAAAYAIRQPVSAAGAAAYEILSATSVMAEATATWFVRAAVESDGAAAYALRQGVGASVDLSYAISLGAVQADATATWAILPGGTVPAGPCDCPTAEQIAAAVRAALAVELAGLLDLVKINGLVPGMDAVVTATSRTAGDVSQTIHESSGTVTVRRA